MLPNQFPPSQCSSYFTQWLISEYLNRVNESKPEDGTTTTTTTTTTTSKDQQQLTVPQYPQQPPKTPPPTPTSPPPHQNHHHSFSAKHFKQFFTHASSKHHHSTPNHSNNPNKPNNNEYKNGLTAHHHATTTTTQTDNAGGTTLATPNKIEFIQLLALNALEFTAPIYSFINKKQPEKKKEKEEEKPACRCPSTRTFVQLSGHPGSFAPAGPKSVWKKMPDSAQDLCSRDSATGKSLRVLLEAISPDPHQHHQLISATDSSSSNRSSHPPQQQLPPSPQDTTPITVFFNESVTTSSSPTATKDQVSSSTSSSSSSSSSSSAASSIPPLLPPQIFSIPTHLLPNETQVYRKVNSHVPPDPLVRIIPKYVTETCYCSQMFLELEDLLTNFSKPNPTIMDIKLGTRTFLESEVKNNKPRPDLYQKLISVDPTACTEEEHEQRAVTKLTYMLFREKQSSSNSLGFRVEGVKIGENGKYKPENQLDDVNFKVLKHEMEIMNVFVRFCKRNVALAKRFLERLQFISDTLEQSEFFKTHEVIGSSLLFIHDDEKTGIWLIDFAKTFPVPGNGRLTHRDPWELGNCEDGVLKGVDQLSLFWRRMVTELERDSTAL